MWVFLFIHNTEPDSRLIHACGPSFRFDVFVACYDRMVLVTIAIEKYQYRPNRQCESGIYGADTVHSPHPWQRRSLPAWSTEQQMQMGKLFRRDAMSIVIAFPEYVSISILQKCIRACKDSKTLLTDELLMTWRRIRAAVNARGNMLVERMGRSALLMGN